ncbi:diguanylate cyclase [Photobacterium sp. GJ3]|uniref:sensor domain-containing diguanylate cyclase n=1 Tax=Photobacterium sp. GJ3 TaxID=2829502 RepID=UPI001B8D76CC|nr:diguanylate cyclase [Photobacterium sp. GJ3]QUJ68948.1 diguanylate cyclase [Photobacterium sp. GJ3]
MSSIWYKSSERAVSLAIEQSYRQNNDVVKDHLDDYFNQIRLIYKQQDLKDNALEALIHNKDQMQRYLIEALRQHPTIEHFYFATPDGGINFAGRKPDTLRYHLPQSYANFFELVETDQLKAGRLNRYVLHPLKNEKILIDDLSIYDARKQPWFYEALLSKDAVWSELIEQQKKQGELSLTLSKAEYSDTGKFLGIWGMDIHLAPLLDELTQSKISPNSIITILGRQGTILTSTHPAHRSKFTELSTISPQQTPLLFEVWKYRYGHDASSRPVYQFSYDGKDWLSYTGYYPLDGDDRITIMMLSPMSDFTAVFFTAKNTAIILTLVLILIATLYGLYGNRYILSPVQQLTRAINNISLGKWGQTLDLNRSDELGKLADAFDNMSRHLEWTITHLDRERQETTRLNILLERQNQELEARVTARTAELKAANNQLEKLAFYDPLTNAPNRRYFWQRFNETKKQGPCWLMLLDVDDFKQFNDTYGHQAGDFALQHLVSVCDEMLQTPDFMGRVGGEEFAICSQLSDPHQAYALAEQILETLSTTPIVFEASQLTITASMGMVECEPGSTSCYARADKLLYLAKRTGKNQVFMESMKDRAEKNAIV